MNGDNHPIKKHEERMGRAVAEALKSLGEDGLVAALREGGMVDLTTPDRVALSDLLNEVAGMAEDLRRAVDDGERPAWLGADDERLAMAAAALLEAGARTLNRIANGGRRDQRVIEAAGALER